MEQYKLVSDKGTQYLVKDKEFLLRLPSGFQFPVKFDRVTNLPPAEGEKVTFHRDDAPDYETQPIVKVEKFG